MQIEEQNARIQQDADTIKRCQQSESDLTKALQLANQKVAILEADCVKKDKEIEDLRRQLEVTDPDHSCTLACVTSERFPICAYVGCISGIVTSSRARWHAIRKH
jgi:hypothetical protein